MERRDCVQVIRQILEKVPAKKTKLIKDLKECENDANYKAPEETIQWINLGLVLEKHIPIPKKDWEWEVASIVTTKSIEELKEIIKKSS